MAVHLWRRRVRARICSWSRPMAFVFQQHWAKEVGHYCLLHKNAVDRSNQLSETHKSIQYW